MIMVMKKEYSAPEPTVVTFTVENGFIGSNVEMRTLILFDDMESNNVEGWAYNEDDETFGGGNISWL